MHRLGRRRHAPFPRRSDFDKDTVFGRAREHTRRSVATESVVRRRWYDVDYLEEMFPRHAALFDCTANDWADWDPRQFPPNLQLPREYDSFLRSFIEELERRDLERRRLCRYEIWYRVWQRAVPMRLRNDAVIDYNARKPRHQQAAGLVQLQLALLSKVRLPWADRIFAFQRLGSSRAPHRVSAVKN